MNDISLIFPHQLFREHPALDVNRPVWLVEEWLFFSQYRFHKQKLIFHRASMMYYADHLRSKGHTVRYIDCTAPEHDLRILFDEMAGLGITSVHYAEPTDDWLEKRMARSADSKGLRIFVYPSPYFMNRKIDTDAFFKGRKRYFQTDFYTWQRKQRRILMEPDGTPTGGKWTFDDENRIRLPKGEPLPAYRLALPDTYTQEAAEFVDRHFPENYGNSTPPFKEGFPWAWTFEASEMLLDDFLHNRLERFGKYEDAMAEKEHFLFHSILSPMLNTGLLEPAQVIKRTLDHATQNDIPMNSLEGFIRQIMGWREFIRALYEREGSRQRTQNFWGFSRKIPERFWTGKTGIAPVDSVIRKLLITGYSHHIERLMVMGNFFLLCEFDPDDVHKWFMELYIDAYDWVMVPNVYGMTQFADGGLMMTKPYISGSNYLMKMGDWKKSIVPQTGRCWTETWDALFWRFMHVHRDFFLRNPRLGMLVNTFDKMNEEKKGNHLRIAAEFLKSLDV